MTRERENDKSIVNYKKATVVYDSGCSTKVQSKASMQTPLATVQIDWHQLVRPNNIGKEQNRKTQRFHVSVEQSKAQMSDDVSTLG